MPPEQAKRSTRRSRKTAATVSPSGQSVKQLPLPPPFAAPQEEHGRGAGDEPVRRYVPNFSQGALRWLVDDAGVRYLWAGDLLGGRPTDPVCYRDGIVRPGNVDYEVVARQPWYQEGIVQLLTVAQGGATAMMCSEEDPRRCHRHRLIEPSLRERGVTVVHIRADGNLEMIDSAAHDDAVVTSPQMVLALFEFGE
jgi:uncharacterized protein (DUF488 family)